MPVEFEENNSFKNINSQANFNRRNGSGMVNCLIRNNIARDEKQANQVLIVIAIICFILSAYIFMAYGLGMRIFS
jgi:hypothetical protein